MTPRIGADILVEAMPDVVVLELADFSVVVELMRAKTCLHIFYSESRPPSPRTRNTTPDRNGIRSAVRTPVQHVYKMRAPHIQHQWHASPVLLVLCGCS